MQRTFTSEGPDWGGALAQPELDGASGVTQQVLVDDKCGAAGEGTSGMDPLPPGRHACLRPLEGSVTGWLTPLPSVPMLANNKCYSFTLHVGDQLAKARGGCGGHRC